MQLGNWLLAKNVEFGTKTLIETHLCSILQELTVDTITTCAFGFDTDIQTSDDKTFLDICRDAMSTIDASPPPVFKLLFLLTGKNS